MKKFNAAVKVGTKVRVEGEYGYRVVKSLNTSRTLIEVQGLADSSHQQGHILNYTNRANVEMYPALEDLYVADAYGSVYERKDDANYFIGKLNNQSLKQFIEDYAAQP